MKRLRKSKRLKQIIRRVMNDDSSGKNLIRKKILENKKSNAGNRSS